MKKIIATIFLLTACASSFVIPQEFNYTEIKTPYFTLASWQKITCKDCIINIYIEGDGHAFNAKGYPTNNPTPHGTFVREMAFNDNNPNVVYLARPCQFVKNNKCQKLFWTTGRFAPEVIESSAFAIKQIAKNRAVNLTGFSGGAQVAGLVAVMHPEINVVSITNYAPNLDHKAWVKEKNLMPLTNSLSLSDYQEMYLEIKQMNYIPEDDKIINPTTTTKFLMEDISKYQIIKGAGHNFK